MKPRLHQLVCWLLVASLSAATLSGCPPNTPFQAEFTAVPEAGQAPLQVRFTDITAAGGASIASWQWAFGDGESSTLQNPTHLYTQPGTYTVSLTVSNGADRSTEVKPDHIIVMGPFRIKCRNVGAYPITDIFIVKANATNWGYNRLSAPLEPGDEVILAREFDQGQHMVGVVFSVNSRFEDVILRGNLNTVGMPDEYVTLSAFRRENGEIGVGYQWGLR